MQEAAFQKYTQQTECHVTEKNKCYENQEYWFLA